MRLAGAAHAAVSLITIFEKAMKIREMNGIDIAFVGLLVIAIVKNLGDIKMILRGIEKIVIGQQRRLSRSHIGKDRSRLLRARIGAMANLVAMFTAAGLARLFETVTLSVIEPAMIEAAQTAVFDPAITEICATMGAVNPQKPDSPLVVAK